MMRMLDFSSWQGVLTTVLGLMLVTLIGMGMRILMMMTLVEFLPELFSALGGEEIPQGIE